LTPPSWQWPVRGEALGRVPWGKVQHELWREYVRIVEAIGPPIDVLIANGDLIDGRGEATGGTELVTTNRLAQVEMAAEALSVWEARRVILIYGTAYHTGKYEDLERLIAESLGGVIDGHAFVQIEGVTFDVKHRVGSSSIPHGRGTPLARERLWNVLWAERGEQPRADVLLRSHVHYFTYIGENGWLAMILPALQAAGTKYGGRQKSNTVDWGLVEFEVDGGDYRWKAHVKRVRANRRQTIVIS